MASPTVKSTYSLDERTVATLEALARRWGVPKSEAPRRIIRTAAGDVERDVDARLDALDALQRAVGGDAAQAWLRAVRDARRASTRDSRMR